jgi:hypothetical protein
MLLFAEANNCPARCDGTRMIQARGHCDKRPFIVRGVTLTMIIPSKSEDISML